MASQHLCSCEVMVCDGLFEGVEEVSIHQNSSNSATISGVKVVKPDVLEFSASTTLDPDVQKSYDTVHISNNDTLYRFNSVIICKSTKELQTPWNSIDFQAISMETRKL